MVQREKLLDEYLCPTCSAVLKRDGERFICQDHGVFLAYGENLLVRAPSVPPRNDTTLPWESLAA